MTNVIPFPQIERRGIVTVPSLQVSYYTQEDGSKLFAIEGLYPDGKWDILHHSRDIGEAWKLAGLIANERGLQLLPESLWPECSHLRAM